MSDSLDRLDERHAAAKAAQVEADEKLNEYVNRVRERTKEDFDVSEQGQVRAQIDEADRIMRLPTPQALKAMGSVVPKDVTRFPSE